MTHKDKHKHKHNSTNKHKNKSQRMSLTTLATDVTSNKPDNERGASVLTVKKDYSFSFSDFKNNFNLTFTDKEGNEKRFKEFFTEIEKPDASALKKVAAFR